MLSLIGSIMIATLYCMHTCTVGGATLVIIHVD